jgi:hypothetical protein
LQENGVSAAQKEAEKFDAEKQKPVGPVTEARRADPLPSPSWGSEISGLGNGAAEPMLF